MTRGIDSEAVVLFTVLAPYLNANGRDLLAVSYANADEDVRGQMRATVEMFVSQVQGVIDRVQG